MIRIVIIILILGVCILLLVKLYNYEKRQNYRITTLTNQINELMQKNEFIKRCENGYFNYLAIGNSITLHPPCNFWWNECGMASTTEDNDYFHIVSKVLYEKHGQINSQAFCFYLWEVQSTDRAETLLLLQDYLSKDLNLITVQLGENAQDISTFESDFQYLLNFINEKSPNAQIVVIGDFWEFEGRDEIKEKVCKVSSIEYIDLTEIKDNPEYYCGLGTIVYDKNGNAHKVSHNGVAKHPNDNAMRYIADKVLKSVVK